MDNIDTIAELISHKVLTQDLKLSTKAVYLINKNVSLLQLIYQQTSFLEYDACIKTRLRCIIQDITEQPKCESCYGVLKMRLSGRDIYTFPTYCSSKCFSGLETTKTKRIKTNIEQYGTMYPTMLPEFRARTNNTNTERYGSNNPLASTEIKEKAKDTSIARYGVAFPAQSEMIKQKTKQTNIERYGTDYACINPDVRAKKEVTNIRRYGVDNVFKDPTMQQTIKEKQRDNGGIGTANGATQQKVQKTMNERHGVSYPLSNATILKKQQDTMIDRYGVTYALQLTENQSKAIDAARLKNLELFNVEYFSQQHISEDTLTKLNNDEWLFEQHHTLEKTLTRIAQELNVTHSTVGLYCSKLNIPILTHKSSQAERDLVEICRQLYSGPIVTNTKQVIAPYELDIFFPELKLAIEFDGIYWHSELNGKPKKYHRDKTKECEKLGIRLIHIWSNEFEAKSDIVLSRLKSALNQTKIIYARQCNIITVDKKTEQDFLDQSHIQGRVGSSIQYGLEHQGELVALMTFGKSRYGKQYQYELLRFCNTINTTVVGGASRLFNHFVKMHNPQSIISYCDLRWGTGDMYLQLGFTYSHTAEPNYFYFKPSECNRLMSRLNFQKHKLINVLDDYDPNISEWNNMKNNNYDRIWDCGNAIFSWVND